MYKSIGAASFLFFSLISAQATQYGPWINDVSLGDTYPYVVHLPANNQQTLPPTILMLGGKGSNFQQGVTFPLESTVSYGGAGWRVGNYFNGSRAAADVLVAEQFTVIVPYINMWNANAQGEANFTVAGVMAVLNDAMGKYPIDPSRTYLGGYSMGARICWQVLDQNPTVFAAAAISAGVPVPIDTSNLNAIASTPLQIYTGTADYEAYSQQWMSEAYYNALLQDGDAQVQYLPQQGVNHNDMQQIPFDLPMFNFFLNNTNTRRTGVTPEASATAINPSAEAAYSSIYASYNSYWSANSADYYNAGVAPQSRPGGFEYPSIPPTAAPTGTGVVVVGASLRPSAPTAAVDDFSQNARSSDASRTVSATALTLFLGIALIALR